MRLKVNGDWIENLPDGMSVAALLAHLQLPEKKIAIERNLEIVSKSTFNDTKLADGDQLEIIHFIGGG